MASSEHFVYASVSFSQCSLIPTWSPSHRMQFLTASSYKDPSHRIQLSKNCSSMAPFQWGGVLQEQVTGPAWKPSPTESSLCGLLLQHGLSAGFRFLQGISPVSAIMSCMVTDGLSFGQWRVWNWHCVTWSSSGGFSLKPPLWPTHHQKLFNKRTALLVTLK